MIIHLDLDCYFVSAERTRSPELKGKPVVVVKSGDRDMFSTKDRKCTLTQDSGAFNSIIQQNNNWSGFNPNNWKKHFYDHQTGHIHGMVLARSYECKSYGIKTTMLLSDALHLCPTLLVVPGDHLFYQLLSNKLKSYLETVIPSVEQYSIDEFWGDLSGWIKDEDTEDFVRNLQQEIVDKFDLPISIGASSAKWIAKLATDFNKPYGITIVPQDKIIEFVSPLPINVFPGVGKSTQAKLSSYCIKTLGDIIESRNLLYGMGRYGKDLYARITGTDDEKVIPYHDRRSIGISRNFETIKCREEIKRRVIILARHLAYTVAKIQAMPTTYYFKIKYDGAMSSKISKTIDRPFSEQLLKEVALETISEIDTLPHYGILHMGISVSNFVTPAKTKTFSLLDHEEDQKNCALNDKITKLRDKFGIDIIRCGVEK